MIRALMTAATGMYAQALMVDVIANNLANVNTTGFKRSKVEFQDLLYEILKPKGSSTTLGTEIPAEIQIGHGTHPVAVEKVFSQGTLTPTENPLDIAIQGNGFFQILRPDGTLAYTRDGTFKLSADGYLVTSDGFRLQPEISIPADATQISISSDGTVSVILVGESEPQTVGQIELAKFTNPAALESIGKNLYLPTVNSGEPIVGTPGTEGFGTLMQGYLELSNVDVVEEMVNLIIAQRAYEINSKAIKTAEQMLSVTNNLVR